jgi:hypothetical protein
MLVLCTICVPSIVHNDMIWLHVIYEGVVASISARSIFAFNFVA